MSEYPQVDRVMDSLREYIRTSFDVVLDDEDQPWKDTAMNSMQFVYLAFFMEEQYGFVATDALMDRMTTLRTMAEVVVEHGVVR